jgi:cell division protein ZapA
MSDDVLPVTVRILDKEYRVACNPDEQDGLLESARMLDQNMRQIRQSGRVIGSDRIAVMAALNIAHELILLQRAREDADDDRDQRLQRLQNRLADALAEERALDDRRE